MIINPSITELILISRELQSDRMREAEKHRLIKQAVGRKSSPTRKLLVIIRSRWNNFLSRLFSRKRYIHISREPENSPSL